MAEAVARKPGEKKVPENIQSWPKQVREYVDGLRAEMRRVTWPTREQVRATTGVVILTVFAFALFFWVVDVILSRTITSIQVAFTK